MSKRDEFPDPEHLELSGQDANPRHLDEFYDYEEFDDYEADDPQAEPVPVASSAEEQGRTLPLRALAIILIIVALLLVAWGIYAATNKDDDSETSSQSSSSSSVVVPVAPAPGAPAPGAPVPGEGQDSAAQPEGQQPEDQSSAEAARDAEQAAPATQNPPAGGDQQAARAPKDYRVYVLNNSMVQGLAAQVGDDLRGDGWQVADVGNYNTSVVPQNTVYFDPADPHAEQAARELADQVGGVAVARPGDLPTETRDGIVVVLAG